MTAVLTWDAERDGLSALPVRVRSPPEWWEGPGDDALTLVLPRDKTTSMLKRRVAPILLGLRDGVAQADLVAACVAAGRSREGAERSVRQLLGALIRQGHVEIELPPVPEVLDARFRVLRELGRGGVGVAWLCEDLAGGGEVVVKHAWNWSGPLGPRDARIREEGDLLARLDHPYVTRLVARFVHDGRHHLARSFVPGKDLADRYAVRGCADQALRRTILETVADALAHLHARGLLCLDLNPSNFIPHDDGRPILVDAGHARSLDAPLRGGSWGGRGYVAPDVAAPGGYGPAADVYGFAALAHFLVTGRPPGDDPAAAVAGTPEEALVRRGLAATAAARPADPAAAVALLG